jgi:carbon-monoxide dehydrogenase large subunit
MACREAVARGRTFAATRFGVASEALAYEGGAYRVGGASESDGLTFAALVAALAGPSAHPLSIDYAGKFGSTYPNDAHVAEVEVDPATGAAQVVAYIAADDLGRRVNQQLVEGLLHGGVAQGCGEVFGEVVVLDPALAQPRNASFMDYPMPRAGWCAGITLVDAGVPTAANPLGSKGAGEAGATGSLPALMNAVADALASAGAAPIDMPVTPARLWGEIRAWQR